VQVLTERDRSIPLYVTTIATFGEAIGVDASTGRVTVAGMKEGFHIIDTDNPVPPPVLASMATPGDATGVFLVGEALYVCDGVGGIQVVDVGDPGAPRIVDAVIDYRNSRHLAVQDGVAFVANGAGQSVGFLDVTDPFAPQPIGLLGAGAERVAVKDSVLLLAQMFGGVSVYRVDGMAGAEFIENVGTGGVASDVAIYKSHAVVANGYSGLMIIDISVPASPRILGSLPLNGATGICIVDHYALVASGAGGVHIVDIESPATPVYVTGLTLPGRAMSVSVTGNTAYVASGVAGVHVVGIRDIANPRLIGTLKTEEFTAGTVANAQFLYVGDKTEGLVVTRAQCAIE